MCKFRLPFAVLACMGGIAAPASGQSEYTAQSNSEKVVAGWVENGWIGSPAIKVKVKLDTGARTSSIHAARFREYRRDGARRVSFALVNNDGMELKFDRPVVRITTIRRKGVEISDRPVILLEFCVAGIKSKVEFIMADRSDLRYPVLIGRDFLAGKILVDPARTFQTSGHCTKNLIRP